VTPSTGRPGGKVNLNSGAESTIHTLLTMETLDANPALKAEALGINKTVGVNGITVVEAESGIITGSGSVITRHRRGLVRPSGPAVPTSR